MNRDRDRYFVYRRNPDHGDRVHESNFVGKAPTREAAEAIGLDNGVAMPLVLDTITGHIV